IETSLPKELEAAAQKATPQVLAHPNPFNPSTQIRFAMKNAGIAKLRIYNLNGQLIRELLNEYRVAGEHRVPWDGRDDRGRAAASGVYFIRFEAGKEVEVNKVMLVR
ncbi:MAG: T9SS type A sorting domain-containing protein, partial [bacterium]